MKNFYKRLEIKTPEFDINNADDILKTIISELKNGVKNREHPYHLLAISNINLLGEPEVRNVVHRDCDFNERKIFFHTDYRCKKVAEIAKNNRVSLLFYSPLTKMQLRIKALSKIHYNNEITAVKWGQTQPRSKECYSQANISGLELSLPEPKIFDDLEAGYKNFAVCENIFSEIDCLILHHQGHKRYKFLWNDNNNLSITQIAP